MSSPTSRALQDCARRGWRAAVVEKWVGPPGRGVRKDVFGFGDLLVLDGKPGALLVQVTSSHNVPGRVQKIREECAEAADDWLRAGNRVEVWGYSKRRELGGTRERWTLDRTPITRGDTDGQRQGEGEERQRP